jgi:four helix bundle protein
MTSTLRKQKNPPLTEVYKPRAGDLVPFYVYGRVCQGELLMSQIPTCRPKLQRRLMTKFSNKFDLEERTAVFGEHIIQLCQMIKNDTMSRPIINQLTRSGTSIGANYMEANGASSKKDFRNKIYICKKEAQETKHWLRMLAQCVPARKGDIRKLWQECHELTLIFHKITMSLQVKN